MPEALVAHSNPQRLLLLPYQLLSSSPPLQVPGPMALSRSLEPTHSEILVPFPALVKLPSSVGRGPGNTSTEQVATGQEPQCPLLPSALSKPWPRGLFAWLLCQASLLPAPPSQAAAPAPPGAPAQHEGDVKSPHLQTPG